MLRELNNTTYNPPFKLTSATHSPGSTETILNSVLIPGSTFKQYDVVGIQTRVVKQTILSGPTVRIRIGPSLSTSETLAAVYRVTATWSFLPLDRRLSIQNLTTDTRVLSTDIINNSSDISGGFTYSRSSLSIDWTVDNYIIVTATSSVNEVINCGYIITDIIESSP